MASRVAIGAIASIILAVTAMESVYALAAPSWWLGVCNKDNYAASYPLGSSHDGII